ncbi:MAG TPA: amidase [Solirubrobacteraceae bacterium]|nr:amidase [Solirubrobacteraceae bacterium]
MRSNFQTTSCWRAGATELATAIRDGAISVEAVIEAHLERITEVNPRVNAITAVLADEARAAAKAADEARRAGGPLGPLHGVPFTIKENIDVAGSPSTWGLPARARAIPPVDAPVVARLKEAGAIPLARTNMPDMGMRWHTDNDLHGPTLNPWDPDRTPGGSSGGEAVAIATGMSPLGLGNDYGGSVRLPAYACGIAGLRPTFGSVPAARALEPQDFPPTLQLFAVEGVLARQIADLELAFDLLRAGDRRDPWWMPVQRHRATDGARVRVAVVSDPGGLGVEPAVREAIDHAAGVLDDAGYEVVEADPPDVGLATELWRDLTAAELRPTFEQLAGVLSSGSLEYQRQNLERIPLLDLPAYLDRFTRRHALQRAWSEFQYHHPLVLGPVSTARMPPVDYDLGGPDHSEELLWRHRLLVTVNLLGLPALAVPTGLVDGMPQGVQLIGDRYHEDLCLRAGKVIEAAQPNLTPIDPR